MRPPVKFLFLALASLGMYTGNANAYDDFPSIPEIIVRASIPHEKQTKTDYVEAAEKYFDRITQNAGFIDNAFVKEKHKSTFNSARQQQRKKLLRLDNNHDDKIDLTELQKYYGPEQKKLAQKRFSELDINQDATISQNEMQILPPDLKLHLEKRIARNYQIYLDIDPNKNGKLTKEEFKTLSAEAFATFDTDSNNIISKEEVNRFMKYISDTIGNNQK